MNITMYTTVTLPVVFYGSEASALTRREKHRLRVSEKRALGKIFRPKRKKERSDRAREKTS
jgi:hypothetical protein